MANGDNFLKDMDVEDRIKGMNDRELMEFTARQVYDICGAVSEQDKKIKKLEVSERKITSLFGGIGTVIGASVIWGIDFFLGR